VRKSLLLAIVVFSAAATVYGALGDIVSSFPAPASSPRGLARANGVLFCLDYNTPNYVYRLSPSTGAVTGSWPAPYTTGNRGLAYIYGGYVYVGCWSNDTIYRCDSGDGSVIASWAAGHDPNGLAPVATGDGGSGATSLYCSDSSPIYFWEHHYTTGSIMGSFAAPHSSYNDIAYDWRNQIIWQYDNDQVVYGIDTSGSVVASFAWTGYGSYNGITYHGEYLFIAADTGDTIYRVHCPNNVGVRPASMGKVKAIFR
jgi:hypothetical protein